MPMTVWRVYSAEVLNAGPNFVVLTYNMFGALIKEITIPNRLDVRMFLEDCKREQPTFKYVWEDE